MTVSDIVSIICTSVLTILIFWLERRQYKKDKAEAEKNRIEELKHKAEIFLIENGDEIQFLPLCVFANYLNPTKKHKRKIYNNFNMCSDELKKYILDKKKIFIRELPQNKWFDICVNELIKDIDKFNLGKNLFYNNAKYVQRCMFLYNKEIIPSKKMNIKFQDYYIENNKMIKRKIYDSSLYLYIDRFLWFLQHTKEFKNPSNIKYDLPCSVVYERIVDKSEKEYCYWSAVLMRFICSMIRQFSKEYSLTYSPYSETIDVNEKYYEDIYYCALYELFLTYGKKTK